MKNKEYYYRAAICKLKEGFQVVIPDFRANSFVEDSFQGAFARGTETLKRCVYLAHAKSPALPEPITQNGLPEVLFNDSFQEELVFIYSETDFSKNLLQIDNVILFH